MLTENQLFANRYRLVKRLGQGAFSEVWEAEDTKVGNLTVALKVYAPDKGLDEDGAKVFGDEFAIVFNLHHQNLLTPSSFDEENGSPYLVLPFCERGSATLLIGKVDEQQSAKFLHDVSSALAYLHAKNIVHQDIKPDNVLIDGEGSFLVTDFGISTRIRSTLRKTVGDKKSAGTRAYMGPERFSKNPDPIKASDVWSLGATLFELMKGDVPFGEDGGLVQKIGAETPDIPGAFSPELKLLVERCLAPDTWDRPTATQLRDICDGYLRTGVWDLSALGKGGGQEPEKPKEHAGRPTERKVRTATPDNPDEQVKKEPAKLQRAKPKMNKKRWTILLSVIVGLAAICVTTLVIVHKEKIENERIGEEVSRILEEKEEENVVQELPERASNNVEETVRREQLDKPIKVEESQLDKAIKYYNNKQYAKALPLFRQLADKGDATAQNFIGCMYDHGRGVEQNYSEAAKWFRKAAEQGDHIAQGNLGMMCEHGKGVDQNYSEAAKWYRKAADQGNVAASYFLAKLYHDGKGVNQDYSEAMKWYRKAANKGYSDAQVNIGYMYDNGHGVPQDYSEAVKWYRKAAEQGNLVALGNMGIMYEYGKGVSKDLDTAKEWYRKAAKKGNQAAKDALTRLGESW